MVGGPRQSRPANRTTRVRWRARRGTLERPLSGGRIQAHQQLPARETADPLEGRRDVRTVVDGLVDVGERGLAEPRRAEDRLHGVLIGKRERRPRFRAWDRRPSRPSARSIATDHSLCSCSCQTIITRRPAGRSATARLANAATGSSKNIVPNRLMARSKPSAGKRRPLVVPPCSKATLWDSLRPGEPALRSIIEAERSTPSALLRRPRGVLRRPAGSTADVQDSGRPPACCTCGEGPRRAAGARRRSRRGQLGVPEADPARSLGLMACRARFLAVVRVHRTRSYDSGVRRLLGCQ